MSLSNELKEAMDAFDQQWDAIFGKHIAHEIRAYFRDKYHFIRTNDEIAKEEQQYSVPGREDDNERP